MPDEPTSEETADNPGRKSARRKLGAEAMKLLRKLEQASERQCRELDQQASVSPNRHMLMHKYGFDHEPVREGPGESNEEFFLALQAVLRPRRRHTWLLPHLCACTPRVPCSHPEPSPVSGVPTAP